MACICHAYGSHCDKDSLTVTPRSCSGDIWSASLAPLPVPRIAARDYCQIVDGVAWRIFGATVRVSVYPLYSGADCRHSCRGKSVMRLSRAMMKSVFTRNALNWWPGQSSLTRGSSLGDLRYRLNYKGVRRCWLFQHNVVGKAVISLWIPLADVTVNLRQN